MVSYLYYIYIWVIFFYIHTQKVRDCAAMQSVNQKKLHHFKNNSLDEFLEITIITDQTSSSMVLLNGQTNGFGYANFKNHLYMGMVKGCSSPNYGIIGLF